MVNPRECGITVAVATMGPRLPMLRLPKPRGGLQYLVLVQDPALDLDGALPTALHGRSDIKLTPLKDRGLSHSRNAAIVHAKDPLLVFSDDDLALEPDGLLKLGEAFIQDPNLDLVAGWRRELGPRGGRHRLTMFNSGRICSPELMVRREAIQARGLKFDPEFGLGARFGLGEEYVFVTDALKAGCKGLSLPVVTGAHPHSSTGDDWRDAELMHARYAMLKRVFAPWHLLIRPIYAWRHRRRFSGYGEVLRFALGKKFSFGG